MKRALIVVTSHGDVGNTGKKTGYYLPEVSHPFVVLEQAGYTIDFASPQGGKAPMDPKSRNLDDRDNIALLENAEVMAKLENTIASADVRSQDYEVILFAGGLGTMWDFASDEKLAAVAGQLYDRGGVVAAVCHGPAALLNVRLQDGSHLLSGRSVAGFSNDEEAAAGNVGVVPFLLETELVNKGAIYSKAPLWKEHVIVSERLVTGQNPASAKAVALAALRAASARKGSLVGKIASTVGAIASALALSATVACGSSTAPVEIGNAHMWTASENISAPESVCFDVESKLTFISNVAGSPGEKDGLGWIASLTLDANGQPVVSRMIEGLNAPKGLSARDGILWATDIDAIVKVDIATHQTLERIAVPGAQFLNDVAIADDGAVYVADTVASKIFRVRGSEVDVFAAGDPLEGPNGLAIVGNRLYIAAWGLIADPSTFSVVHAPGNVYFLDLTTGAKTLVTKTPLGNLDGLDFAPNGDLLVSDFVKGTVYRIDANGEVRVLLEGLKNSADLGVRDGAMLVPEMGADRVSAFLL